MLHTTRGIVLHTIKYGDTSIIAHIYTRDFGRQAYMVNGVRNKKSKFHFNNFQPLTLLKLEVDHKPSREIQRIRDLQLNHPLHQLHSDIKKNTIALFIGEILYRSLHDVEANHALFDYAESSIQILDLCEKGCVNFHLLFLVQFTRFLGIFPQNNLELDFYQPKGVPLKLHDLIKYSLNDLALLELTNIQRNEMVTAMVDYYYNHLEGIKKISSLKVLQEVFS
jgi:DNA repair protein RecO (recombination protein O)